MTRVRVYDDFDSLLATIEAADCHVVFPAPISESAEKLLRTLGVTWAYDTHAPVLGTTFDPQDRRQRSPEEMERRREKKRRYRQRKRAQQSG